MPEKLQGELEAVRLNEDAARRLIQRATELDASLATESSVAELREAARGAGISDEAFQRALDEVRAQSSGVQTPAPRFGTFPPRKYLALAAIALLIGAILLVFMRGTPLPNVVEEAVPAAEQPPPLPAPPTSAPPALPPRRL